MNALLPRLHATMTIEETEANVIRQLNPCVLWAQTETLLMISIHCDYAVGCVFYPHCLILSPVDSPDQQTVLKFYEGVNNQPIKLRTLEDQTQVIWLSKSIDTMWPRLFQNQDLVRLVYINDGSYALPKDEDDFIDFDEIVSKNGNKTGLEM
ncbi:hypothetical protein DM01DRAFT_1403061 [Hesseltinella vesiculosa]|uniref:CS domain-containing protein n=1 Tax=Hesseltinella vesiculosa TaxID=101127 RepID=A0A1X2GWX6_9FUNG|nr:hypothetical protein DM01DRAFT_1403061 [Hesseltinella vesiculosa]